MATLETAIAKYLEFRKMKKEMEERHKLELASIKTNMEKLEGYFQAALNKSTAKSIKTELGTIYESKRVTVAVRDWTETLPFIREHDLWEMLPRSVNKTAVESYLEAQGELPPGLSMTVDRTVNVRTS